MEDYEIDIMIGKGATARSIRLDLSAFYTCWCNDKSRTFISHVKRLDLELLIHLEFYNCDELKKIIVRSAEVLGVDIDDDGAYELARRSRGTPRLATDY